MSYLTFQQGLQCVIEDMMVLTDDEERQQIMAACRQIMDVVSTGPLSKDISLVILALLLLSDSSIDHLRGNAPYVPTCATKSDLLN